MKPKLSVEISKWWVLIIAVLALIGVLIGYNMVANATSAPPGTSGFRAFNAGGGATPTACTQESTMITPQGEWQSDGTFIARDLVAPQGWSGIIFDGQLQRGGPHVFLVFLTHVVEQRYLQGTWYAVCPDPVQVAMRIADEKEDRNPGLHIQVWDQRVSPPQLLKELPSTSTSPTATGSPAQSPAATATRPAATPTATTSPSTGLDTWSKRLGVPINRLEAAPGESLDTAVHIKDGNVISVTIPAGFSFEGWDGSKTVKGNGPATVNLAGGTVRSVPGTPGTTPTSVAATPTQTSSGLDDWSKRLGVPTSRLESAPGEPLDKTVHVKDGNIIPVTIPQGFTFEGWDGSKKVNGTGPATINVSGATVRVGSGTTPGTTPTSVAATPTSTSSTWPANAQAASSVFGGDASRWEGCTGEVLCWHLRDGNPITLNVPSFAWIEGWDGSNTIPRTNGPVSIKVVGATLRPR
ncbi:hypothetical protein HY439_00690 [Candidatus Microgenomates bacterium]|nr:hypothetical protein [Candidatus Microgenomates bacterium]